MCKLLFFPFLLLFAVTASCTNFSTDDAELVQQEEYRLQSRFNPNLKGFELTLTSHSERDMCIGVMQWPTKSGEHFRFGDSGVFFEENGSKYFLKNYNSGYCSGPKRECVIRIAPHKDLMAYLPIEDFDVNGYVYSREGFSPELTFPVNPWYCQ